MLANELFVCSVIFIPNKENRSRLFNAMVCGQKNIDHQTDAGNSGFRYTLEQKLWARLGTMHSGGPEVIRTIQRYVRFCRYALDA